MHDSGYYYHISWGHVETWVVSICARSRDTGNHTKIWLNLFSGVFGEV